MAEEVAKVETEAKPAAAQSPPAAPVGVKTEMDEPRTRLHQLAEILRGGVSRQLLLEYMQLRRALR
jgi:hypothetical protein